MVEAIVKPFKLDEVKEALTKAGVQGMTRGRSKGLGRQKGHTTLSGGADLGRFFAEGKDSSSADDKAAKVVEVITESAKTARLGDRQDFRPATYEEVIRIRTGEKGPDAI